MSPHPRTTSLRIQLPRDLWLSARESMLNRVKISLKDVQRPETLLNLGELFADLLTVPTRICLYAVTHRSVLFGDQLRHERRLLTEKWKLTGLGPVEGFNLFAGRLWTRVNRRFIDAVTPVATLPVSNAQRSPSEISSTSVRRLVHKQGLQTRFTVCECSGTPLLRVYSLKCCKSISFARSLIKSEIFQRWLNSHRLLKSDFSICL